MNSTESFRKALNQAHRVTVLTGAGVSAESGIPTFRGPGGLWRKYSAPDLANPAAWARNPGLVWEFYNYRRRTMIDKQPNPGHKALAELEARMIAAGRVFTLLTQNIDDLHLTAGSKNVVRLHGSIWQVRCTRCGLVTDNRDIPITPAFADRDGADPSLDDPRYATKDLPTCYQSNCSGVLRPNVVWFTEPLEWTNMEKALSAIRCDLFLVVGTSAVVYPAAGFVPGAKDSGAKVAEINLEPTPMSDICDWQFHGPAGEWLPKILG